MPITTEELLKKETPETRKERIRALVDKHFNTREEKAAILGNIDVETDGSYDYLQAQKDADKPATGLIMMEEPMRNSYDLIFLKNKEKEDSDESQILFLRDTLYNNQNPAHDIGQGNRQEIIKSFGSGDVDKATETISDRFFNPGEPHLDRRKKSSKEWYDKISSLNPFQVKEAQASEVKKKVITTQELLKKKKGILTTEELLRKRKSAEKPTKPIVGLEEARKKLGLQIGKTGEEAKPYNSWQYPIASIYHQIEKAGRAVIGLPWQAMQEFPDRVMGKYRKRLEKALKYPEESKSAIDRGIDEIHKEINKQADYWRQPGPVTKRVLANREAIKKSARKGAGSTGEVLADLMFMGEDLGSMLIQMGLIGKISPAQIKQGLDLKRYGKLAAHGFVTTSGNLNDRTRSAIYRVAYNMTPAIVNATGVIGLKATAVDIALNSFITSPSYQQLYKERGLSPEFFKQAIPLFFTDVVMALSTRGLPQNQRRAILENHQKNWVKQAPELRLPQDELDRLNVKIDTEMSKEDNLKSIIEAAGGKWKGFTSGEGIVKDTVMFDDPTGKIKTTFAMNTEDVTPEAVKAKLGFKPPSAVMVSKKQKEKATVEEKPVETLQQKWEREQAEKKARVREIPAKKGLKVLPKKAQLLTQLDEAIKKAPNKASVKEPTKVTFETDGGANIINTKEALTAFKAIIQKTAPTMRETTAPKSPPTSTAGKKEDIGLLYKGMKEGWFTDGKLVIKGKPPKSAKVGEKTIPKDDKTVQKVIDEKGKPAEFQYYFIKSGDRVVEGKSTEPIAKSGEATGKVLFKTDDGYYTYEQDKFNAIRNRYPNATYEITKGGVLKANYQGQPVGILLPVLTGGYDKLPLKQEPIRESGPVTKEPTKEPISVKEKTDITEDAWLESPEGKKHGKLADEETRLMKIRPQTSETQRKIAELSRKQGELEEKFIANQKKPVKRLTTEQLKKKAKKKPYKAASIDPAEIHNAFDKTPDPKKSREEGPKLPSWKPKQIPPTTSSQEEISFPLEGGRHITKIYEKEIGPVLQISKRFKKFAGVYYGKHPQDKGSGLVRVKNMENFHTLAHETGHFLDDVLAKYPLTQDQKLELLEVTKWRLPFTEKYVFGVSEKTGKATKRADRYTSYRRSRTELFADYMGVLITKPEIAEKLAPQFTAVVKGEIAKDTEFAWITKKMREYFSEFKVIKDYVDQLRKIPEIEPHIKAWAEQGNLLQNLWRNKVGDIVWNKVSGFVDRFGQTRVGQVVTEKKGLSDTTFEILRQRKHLIDGQFLRAVDEIIKPMSKLSKDDQERIAENLQRFEILEPTDELNRVTEEARRELAVWGNEAKKLGLLNDETFWDQVGQYFPFFYETKEFSQNKAQFGFGMSKTLRANLNSFKHRLSNEEFGRRYLEAKWGTWPSTKAKIDKIDSKKLIRLGIEARKEYGLIKTAPYPLQKRLKLLMQSVYTTKALNSIASQPGVIGTKDMPGYSLLPKGKSLGNLSGQYVPDNIAKEINEFQPKVGDLGRAIEAVVGTWKNFKVPWDPAAMARNAVTNMIAGWEADIPTWKPQVVLSGINSFVRKDNIYQLLRDRGAYRHTYSEVELGKLAFIMETEPDTTMGHIIKWATTAFDTPGKIYGAIEDASKTVIAKYAHSQGASVEQAIKLADKWLFDYSSVSPLVGTLRKLPVPFLTWSAKTFPRLVETAIRKPEKYATIYLAIGVINAMSRKGLGISQDEEEKMKPDYMQGKTKPVLLLPIRDKDNQVQWIDFTYFVPWGGWITPMTKGSIIPQPLQMSNPLMTMYNAYGTNYDPFIGEIQKPYMTDKEKKDAQNKYVLASLLPDLLGGLGSRKIIKGIRKGPEDHDYYGRKPQLGQILLGEIAGIKITKGGETTTKVSNFQRQEKEATTQANRTARLAWEKFYRDRNQENLRIAEQSLKDVRPSYRGKLKDLAKENIKFETSPQRKMIEKMSGPQQKRFRRY